MKGLRRWAHVSDLEQIRFLLRWLEYPESRVPGSGLETLDERRLLMLDLSLWSRPGLPSTIDERSRDDGRRSVPLKNMCSAKCAMPRFSACS